MHEIPLVNLARQYESLKDAIRLAVDQVFEQTAFIKGPFVSAFEQQFSKLYSDAAVTGCANGTAAISLALEALGIGSGDEVLVPSHTFIATAEAVCHVGATPIFVDSNPDTYCMDVESLAAYITPRTRAVLPVHIYGNAVDMTALQSLVSGTTIHIVEDCAQAHLASFAGKPLGLFGAAGTFSFYPGKNLGGCGDSGAVISYDASLIEKIQKLADHGRLTKYEHDVIGYNQRMDGIQAAILSVKLQHLEAWTERRRAVAAQYDACMDSLGLKRIISHPECQPAYHLYVIEVSDRKSIQEKLAQKGISTGVHYPLPLHRQPAFIGTNQQTQLPVVEDFCDRILSIPICGSITDTEVEYICSSLKDALT